MELTEFSLRIGLAAIAGLFVGAEREMSGKNAGLKTNALVALGSCVFVLLSLEFQGEEYVDTSRVLGQVVTGIGFIGAGTIIQQGSNIKGLTTAATIWCSAGIGGLAALSMYKEMAVVCLTIILINFIFGYLPWKIKKNKDEEQVD